MGLPEKKQLKAELKREKKEAKAEIKRAVIPAPTAPTSGGSDRPSPGVRYAEIVRGGLYLLLGASLALALVLGQRGVIVSLEDIIDGLFAAWAGKIVLALIAVALIIYGLKHLRIVR